MNFKNKPVTIVKDDMGNVIRVSKRNAEYAHVRLTQEKTVINNGWINVKTVSTLIHGKTEELIASGIKKYKKLPGNIVIQESLEGEERNLKMAGKTDVVCCLDGQPIYRTTKYDATGMLEDTFIAHNNGQAIKEANAANASTLEDLQNVKVADTEETEEEVDENQIDLEDAIAEVEAEALETPADPDEDEHDELTVEDTIEAEVDEEVEVEENVFTL
tara:strand:- start:2293 stop:2943 length:651 start_codon:yes stop_codon:yes gene_type:complete